MLKKFLVFIFLINTSVCVIPKFVTCHKFKGNISDLHIKGSDECYGDSCMTITENGWLDALCANGNACTKEAIHKQLYDRAVWQKVNTFKAKIECCHTDFCNNAGNQKPKPTPPAPVSSPTSAAPLHTLIPLTVYLLVTFLSVY